MEPILISLQQFLEADNRQPLENSAFVNQEKLRAGFVSPLTHLGLLELAGTDASSFLHRQLSNDVEHLRPNEARLAGYCTPQGRLLATFLLWRNGDRLWLQLPREILPALQKRLQIYVLRDQVKLADVSDQTVRLGLGGVAAEQLLTTWFPQLPDQPYARVEEAAAGTLIRVADAFGAPRYEWIATSDAFAVAWPALATSLTLASDSAWRLADIAAGLPQISARTQELFVPQTVNFDLVGGISFKKGCYPGQEVIARMQHLGKGKRRMQSASAAYSAENALSVAAGEDVYCSTDPNQPCGKIVNAERATADRIACLVSLNLDQQADGALHAGSMAGPALRVTALPYPLPEMAAAAPLGEK